MEENVAQEILSEWQRLDSESCNVMSTYQEIADHFLYRENQITSTRTPGEDLSRKMIDGTGAQDLSDMSAGMSAVVFPQGQYFCRMAADNENAENNESYRRYLAYATQILHRELFKPSCNFMLEINEFFNSWIGFGTGNIFSAWDKTSGRLYFKDWDVACYRFTVDHTGAPNKCLIRWLYTAQQAYDKWGENAGKQILDAVKDPKKSQEKFPFVYRCKRRKNGDNSKSSSNWKFVEEIISEKDKTKVAEENYKTFPYHIARWLTNSQEIWGYGQGNFALATDKTLQKLWEQYLMLGELRNKPPMQTLSSFEGKPKIYPGANNIVMDMDSCKPMNPNLLGDYQSAKDMIEKITEKLDRYFYVKVFKPLEGLPGDRRTTVEIVERVKAGYMLLILPTMRLYNECLTPLIERVVNILIENGIIPPPPAGLNTYKIDYLGRLALALQEQQADALQRYAQFSFAMEQVVPGITEETLNLRRAGRRMAGTFGVNENDLNSEEEANSVRQARQQQQQQQMQLMAIQTGSKAYKDASAKADEDSPAAQMMESMSG